MHCRAADSTGIKVRGEGECTPARLRFTTPIESLDNELKHRAGVVGTFPDEASIMWLIGAVPFERNDE